MKEFGEIPEALNVYPQGKLLAFAEKCGAKDWFGVWQILVDRYLIKAIGLASGDLPDQDYWAYFDSGMNPKDTAGEVLEEDDLDWPNPYV